MDRRKLVKHNRCATDDEFVAKKKRKTEEVDGWKLGKRKGCATEDEFVEEKKRKTEEGKSSVSISGALADMKGLLPLHSDEKEKKLFICCSTPSSSAIWYQINPSRNSRTKRNGKMEHITDVSPICEISSSDVCKGFTPVALGSEIYMLGGWDDYKSEATNHVFCLQTRKPPFVWRKKQPRMRGIRCNPKPVSVHGKIYVFGSNGGGSSTPVPWGEVFDPHLNLWSPLPDPPRPVLYIVSIAVVDTKIILDIAMHNFLSFDVKTYLWEPISAPISATSRCVHEPAILDGVLFMFEEGKVMGYDLLEHKWFTKSVQGLAILECSVYDWVNLDGYVFNIGNKSLCVVWEDVCGDLKTCIRCIKFRVARVNDSRGCSVLWAEVQSRASYHLRGDFGYSLAM